MADRYDYYDQGVIRMELCDTGRFVKFEDYEKLETELAEARKGCFGFAIYPNETLTEGMNRNYAEFDDCRAKLETKLKKYREGFWGRATGRLMSKSRALRQALNAIRQIAGGSYEMPVTHDCMRNNMRIIRDGAKHALKETE